MSISQDKLRAFDPNFDPARQAPKAEMVPDGTKRPLWSVMIPTYNCAELLRQTLESVLTQDPGADMMQIEVVDDCSTKDDPEAVVREVGQGRVEFHRKPKNAGATANFNTCIERSRGELVHILHGDDWILPGFYGTLEKEFARAPGLAGCATRAHMVDESGWIDGLSPVILGPADEPMATPESLFYENWIRTPAVVVRRDFYENFGVFRDDLVHVADWEMWVRIAANGGLGFLNQPLASYRLFAGNDTGKLAKTAENIRDYIRAGCVFQRMYEEFDSTRFSNFIIHSLFHQYWRFRKMADGEAMGSHKRLMNQISSHEFRMLFLQEYLIRRIHWMFAKLRRKKNLLPVCP